MTTRASAFLLNCAVWNGIASLFVEWNRFWTLHAMQSNWKWRLSIHKSEWQGKKLIKRSVFLEKFTRSGEKQRKDAARKQTPNENDALMCSKYTSTLIKFISLQANVKCKKHMRKLTTSIMCLFCVLFWRFSCFIRCSRCMPLFSVISDGNRNNLSSIQFNSIHFVWVGQHEQLD